MNQDAYDLFGKCHRLYITGVRTAIQQRLTDQFDEEWWEQGVLTSLWGPVREQIEAELEKNDAGTKQLLLDSRHFGYIVRKHHGPVFSKAFPNSLRAFSQFRQLTTVRNEWAHVQEISAGRFWQAADMMQDILAALNCEEALQVEKVRAEALTEPTTNAADEPIKEADLESQPVETKQIQTEPVDSWRQLQSYLSVEFNVDPKTVEETTAEDFSVRQVKPLAQIMRQRSARPQAEITIKFENTAPDSPDWPRVVFKNVGLRGVGGQHDPIYQLEPGQVRNVVYKVARGRLIDLDLVVEAEIDGEELLRFGTPTSLPENAIEGIKREFSSQIEGIGIKTLVTEAVNAIGNVDDNLNMREMSEVRKAAQEFSSKVDEKASGLDAVFRSYQLDKSIGLGARIRELRITLDKFQATVREFDQAIGETNPDKLREVQESLKDAQLAVLRVESELRSVGG